MASESVCGMLDTLFILIGLHRKIANLLLQSAAAVDII